jgi:hypothetical protein
MSALRWTWCLAGVLLLPLAAFAQPGGPATHSLEEQTFLQDRIEKRLLNPKEMAKKDPKEKAKFGGRDNGNPHWRSLSSLSDLPKGYTTLLKAYELYKSRAAKSPEEKFEGTTWAGWQGRCLYQLSIHPAITKDMDLFPTELIADYCDNYLPKIDDENLTFRTASIDFIGRLGPRAKTALPRLRELMNSDNDAVALAAFRAIRKIAPTP